MTKDELITEQALKIAEYKRIFHENTELRKQLVNKFYNIGAPLNDNVLKMNKEQLKWCLSVSELAKCINRM